MEPRIPFGVRKGGKYATNEGKKHGSVLRLMAMDGTFSPLTAKPHWLFLACYACIVNHISPSPLTPHSRFEKKKKKRLARTLLTVATLEGAKERASGAEKNRENKGQLYHKSK